METDSWPLMLRFVQLGLGVAVVNGTCTLPEGTVARPIPEMGTITYRLVRRRGARLSASSERLAAPVERARGSLSIAQPPQIAPGHPSQSNGRWPRSDSGVVLRSSRLDHRQIRIDHACWFRIRSRGGACFELISACYVEIRYRRAVASTAGTAEPAVAPWPTAAANKSGPVLARARLPQGGSTSGPQPSSWWCGWSGLPPRPSRSSP